MTTVMGSTYGSKTGVATLSPSTALSTEMAGVIMLSPYSSDAPNSPASTRIHRRLPGRICRAGATRAVSAIIPPSPRLSARITKERYLMEMTMMSDQKMRESTPITFAALGDRP
jgi:hypothetical protein